MKSLVCTLTHYGTIAVLRWIAKISFSGVVNYTTYSTSISSAFDGPF